MSISIQRVSSNCEMRDYNFSVAEEPSVLRLYSEHVLGLLDKMAIAAAIKDLDTYEAAVHEVMDSSRCVGATTTGDEAEVLWAAAIAGDLDYLNKHGGDFIQRVSRFLKEPNDKRAKDRSIQ